MIDFKKLENISQELCGMSFRDFNVPNGIALLTFEVYREGFTIDEAKEILKYLGIKYKENGTLKSI